MDTVGSVPQSLGPKVTNDEWRLTLKSERDGSREGAGPRVSGAENSKFTQKIGNKSFAIEQYWSETLEAF